MAIRRGLGIAFAVLGIVAVVAIAGSEFWIYSTFHTLDPSRPPPLIRVFGREFRGPGSPVTLAQVRAETIEFEPDILHPTLGALPIFLPSQPNSAGTIMFPTLVWVQIGPDAYAPYSLAGGP